MYSTLGFLRVRFVNRNGVEVKNFLVVSAARQLTSNLEMCRMGSFAKVVGIFLLVFVICNNYTTTCFKRDSWGAMGRGKSSIAGRLSRTKRSPFIIAFQVTRPPGLFQFSMRKPVIMGMMSNMTSMILGSELGRMLSRGFSGQQIFIPASNASGSG